MADHSETIQILADALGLATTDIPQDCGFETCPQWDSLAHFRVIAGIEAAIDRQLTPIEIFEASDVHNIQSILSAEAAKKS